MKIFENVKEIFAQKRYVRILSCVFAAVIILIIVIFAFAGQIVKSSIQTVGPLITGVPVTVKSVGINVLGNAGVKINGLVVGNPDGYSSPHALHMKNFELKVKTLSLLSDKIVIDKLELTGVELNFETNLLASNLNDIHNNVKKLSGEKKDVKKEEKKENAEKESAKLQVNTVDIADITVRVIARGGDAAGVPLVMVPIHMKDLGTGPGGISVSALVEEIFTRLFTGVTSLISGGADAVSHTVSTVGDAAEEAGKAVKDAGKNIGKQLKDLLGGTENRK
ncbi:MAG: AsmA family protein [Lentisphaeria bacterium]|nr:AsmA family protein [Lentisphaeria bacterium]